MTNIEAKEYLLNVSYMIGTTAVEYMTQKDGDKIREAIKALEAQDSKTKSCDTCKHDPPSKKWPCVDCDMREPADRWEPKEVRAMCQTIT